MSIREKIIVIIAGLALVYAGWEFGIKNIISRPQNNDYIENQNNLQTQNDLAIFTAEIAAQTAAVKLSPEENYIIKNNNKKWNKDPFISAAALSSIQKKGTIEQEIEKESLNPKQNFIYSGFLELGDVKIAVINGSEYQEGEKLREEGYILRKISPSMVNLSRGKRSLQIHLEEKQAKVK